MMKLSETT